MGPSVDADDVTHAITEEAPPSTKTWTRLLSWDSLRYQGSGWWLDRILPRSPAGLIAAALILPAIWFGIGWAITDDRNAFLDAPDTKWQLWFFALHIVTLRMMASLWSRGLEPALAGLGIVEPERRRVRAGAVGNWANLGAVVAGLFFIIRDTYMALHASAGSGLNAFDDPAMWNYAALGHQIRTMMLVLWHLEWVIFGYLLWLQIWGLYAIARAIRRTDFKPRLARMLIRDEYRDFFTLLGKTSTLSLAFTLGNLLFIYLTGELFPREVVQIDSVGDVFQQMSDVLSISLLFGLIVVGMFVHLMVLRKALTRAVNDQFGAAGDAALELLSKGPLVLTGDRAIDDEAMRASFEAQSAVLRAVTFQREIDALGGRLMRTVLAKAVPALSTAAKRIAKMHIGAP